MDTLKRQVWIAFCLGMIIGWIVEGADVLFARQFVPSEKTLFIAFVPLIACPIAYWIAVLAKQKQRTTFGLFVGQMIGQAMILGIFLFVRF